MSGICAGRRGKVELGDVIIAERLWSYDSGKSVIEDGQDVFHGDMLQYRPSEVFVQHMQSLDIPSDAPWLTERPRLPFEYQENWVLLRLLEGTNPVEHQNFNEDCPNWSEVLPRLWKRDWVKEPLELTEQGRNHIKRVSLLYPKNLPRPADFQVHVAPLATGSVVKEDEFIFPKLAKSMRKVLGLDMEASGLAALSEAHGVPVVVAKAVSDYGDQFKDDRYRNFAARASAESLISLLRTTSHLFLTKSTQIRSVPSAIGANVIPATPSTKALVNMLAELYPDVSETRSLWERAGGKARDIENIPRPRDLWQRLWNRCLQGAVVSPKVLLTTILEEYPGNALIVSQLDSLPSR
jgi:nucleoside phosphorylase